MAATLVHIPCRYSHPDADALVENADHPMRHISYETVDSPDTWTPQRAQQVAGFFDGLAAEWVTRDEPERPVPVIDALERGWAYRSRCVLDLGAGSGLLSKTLAERFERVISVDLSLAMLREGAIQPGHAVRADSSRLPIRSGTVDVVLLLNTFLFPTELDRVVAPDGVILWVNSRGPSTPIHLPAQTVADALGNEWLGVSSTAHTATWTSFRRVLAT